MWSIGDSNEAAAACWVTSAHWWDAAANGLVMPMMDEEEEARGRFLSSDAATLIPDDMVSICIVVPDVRYTCWSMKKLVPLPLYHRALKPINLVLCALATKFYDDRSSMPHLQTLLWLWIDRVQVVVMVAILVLLSSHTLRRRCFVLFSLASAASKWQKRVVGVLAILTFPPKIRYRQRISLAIYDLLMLDITGYCIIKESIA